MRLCVPDSKTDSLTQLEMQFQTYVLTQWANYRGISNFHWNPVDFDHLEFEVTLACMFHISARLP